jgi:hypothetical protein
MRRAPAGRALRRWAGPRLKLTLTTRPSRPLPSPKGPCVVYVTHHFGGCVGLRGERCHGPGRGRICTGRGGVGHCACVRELLGHRPCPPSRQGLCRLVRARAASARRPPRTPSARRAAALQRCGRADGLEPRAARPRSLVAHA